jgi:hypothetical protein
MLLVLVHWYMIGTHLDNIIGICLRHFIDDILWYMVWYLCTWWIYMVDVHGVKF